MTEPTTQLWYKYYGCTHAHCPYECEHPQPFIHNNELVCGRCWFLCNQRTLMIPCTPAICEERRERSTKLRLGADALAKLHRLAQEALMSATRRPGNQETDK